MLLPLGGENMELTIDEIKQWNRIDYDDDDNVLQSLKERAEVFLAHAGVTCDYFNPQYKTCVQFIIQYWYNGQEKIGTSSIGINSMISQLRS